MDQRSTGQQLKAIRLQLGLSQVEIAAHLGVSNVSVNRWEHDRNHPDAATLARYRELEQNGLTPSAVGHSTGNLPRPGGALLGRERELRELGNTVQLRPLVTLVGTGGAGKTRLATEVGIAARVRFSDGVWFVDLAQVVDVGSVGHACIEALRIVDGSRRKPAERIAAHLEHRNLLLILDNCEHVVPACAEIAASVMAAGGLSRILTTSRVPLDVPGETLYPIPAIAPEIATELLVTLVKERRPGYEPDVGERQTIATLCDRLDQLPLAIELAAARMHILSAEQIVERLDRRFDILQNNGRSSERQRTLAATIGWSCDLLDPSERELFRLLGVFSGWFDLRAVEQMSADPSVVIRLDRLASQSMILVDYPADGGPPRYRLLDSLAAYARRWSEELGETDDHHQRHATYFAEVVANAARGIFGPDQAKLLRTIDQIYENVIAALTWGLASGAGQTAGSIARSLSEYWPRRGRHAEGCAWIEKTLHSASFTFPSDRVWLLVSLGTMLISIGRHDDAAEPLAEALNLALDANDPIGEARARDATGLLFKAQGQLTESAEWHESSFGIAKAAGDLRTQAMSRINVGHIANLRGDHQSAEAAYMEALSLIRGSGDIAAESAALANLGEVAERMLRWDDSLAYTHQALTLARQLGDPDRVAILAANEAEALLAIGNGPDALSLADEAAAQFRQSGNLAYLAGSLYLVGLARNVNGRRIEGLAALREAVRIYQQLDDPLDVAVTIEAIAGLFQESGDSARAARWLGGAEAMREALNAEPYPLFDYDALVGAVRASLGELMEGIWAEGRALSPDRLVTEVLHVGRVIESVQPVAAGPAQALELADVLTARQIEILALAADGLSNRDIAEALSISPRTVERHLTAIFTSLGVERRSSAVALAVKAGLRTRRQL